MPNPLKTRSWIVAHRAITYGAPARKPRPLRANEWQHWRFEVTNALGRNVWLDAFGKDEADALDYLLTLNPTVTYDSVTRIMLVGKVGK